VAGGVTNHRPRRAKNAEHRVAVFESFNAKLMSSML
jgi:hypothetical protein